MEFWGACICAILPLSIMHLCMLDLDFGEGDFRKH